MFAAPEKVTGLGKAAEANNRQTDLRRREI